MISVLVGVSDPKLSQDIESKLNQSFSTKTVNSYDQCLIEFRQKRYDFTLVDLEWFRKNEKTEFVAQCKKTLNEFWSVFPAGQIIVVAPIARTREAVQVVQSGANNYLTTPVDRLEIEHILEVTEEFQRLQQELDYLRDQFWHLDSLDIIRTKNLVMQETFDKLKYVSKTKVTILLTGETGVGKGVIAKMIHSHSDRSDKPFVQVHSGAIAENLVESELFGHEKGAFTGAIKRKLGKFELAAGGTIFLDEISTISPSTQVKLLQILQDKIFYRVGGESIINTDARIIAASNSDLLALSQAGEFRSDLYYRLNVFPIHIVPLRERLDDIPLFLEVFIKRFNQTYNKQISKTHPLVLEALKLYNWPGNIREFENIIERAFILETTTILTPESFPRELFKSVKPKAKVFLDTTLSLAEIRNHGVEEIERQYLKDLLTINGGQIKKTAEVAKITPRQVHNLLAKYNIQKKDYKKVTTNTK